MTTTGDCHVVVAVAELVLVVASLSPAAGTSCWCWWQLSSPSDDAWVAVDVIDAEGCPGFVSGGGCVVA